MVGVSCVNVTLVTTFQSDASVDAALNICKLPSTNSSPGVMLYGSCTSMKRRKFILKAKLESASEETHVSMRRRQASASAPTVKVVLVGKRLKETAESEVQEAL